MKNNALIDGLSSEALICIEFNGNLNTGMTREAERCDMGARIREVEQGLDGSIWLLEDGSHANLMQLMPKI